MNLRQIEVFRAIMLTGSVTGAARLLNVTQPTVSAVLKHTESSLRLKLFERQGRHLVPTADARVLARESEVIFEQLSRFDYLIQNLRSHRSGSLNIAATPTLCAALMVDVVKRLLEAGPALDIGLRSVPAHQAAELAARHEVDFSVSYLMSGDIGTRTEVLGTTRLAVFCRKDSPLAARSSLGFDDIRGQRIISYRNDAAFGTALRNAAQLARAEFSIDVRAGAFDACSMARIGAGIAIVDQLQQRSGFFPDLVAIPFAPEVRLDIGVHISTRSAPSVLARRAIEILTEMAR